MRPLLTLWLVAVVTGTGTGTSASRFTLDDLLPSRPLRTLDGTTVTPQALSGRVVLVDVWATWCAPCLAELPTLKALHAEHRANLAIVGISADSLTTRELRQWLLRRGVEWPQVFDGRGPDGPLFTELGIVSLPQTFLFDRGGRLVARNLRGEALVEAVATLSKGDAR